MTAHIPYMGQLIVSYYGLYANADRGKVKKALILSTLRMAEEKPKSILPRAGRR
jgi:hypothetical protein